MSYTYEQNYLDDLKPITPILGKVPKTQCNYAALVHEEDTYRKHNGQCSMITSSKKLSEHPVYKSHKEYPSNPFIQTCWQDTDWPWLWFRRTGIWVLSVWRLPPMKNVDNRFIVLPYRHYVHKHIRSQRNTKLKEISAFQNLNTYCKCIMNSVNRPAVHKIRQTRKLTI